MSLVPNTPKKLGRYALHGRLASGGMASVHLGRLLGPVGFSRTIAIKRLHPQLIKERSFVSMLLDEARLAARIRHPNVVPVIDVVADEGELFLVMEYVHGETLARLLINAKDQAPPPDVITRIVVDLLNGLHAAHTATDERGAALNIVHRDVSPQNVLVGVDGVSRVTDFGVAKAVNRLQSTSDGQVKGKLAYMAPEYLQGQGLDRRADIYSASVLLWEGLTRRRLFARKSATDTMQLIVSGAVPPPSRFAPWLSPVLDEVVMQGLARDPNHRFSSALAMATALQECAVLALPTAVGQWVEQCAPRELELRTRLVNEVEAVESDDPVSLAGGKALVDAVMSTRTQPRRNAELAGTMLLTDYKSPGGGLASGPVTHPGLGEAPAGSPQTSTNQHAAPLAPAHSPFPTGESAAVPIMTGQGPVPVAYASPAAAAPAMHGHATPPPMAAPVMPGHPTPPPMAAAPAMHAPGHVQMPAAAQGHLPPSFVNTLPSAEDPIVIPQKSKAPLYIFVALLLLAVLGGLAATGYFVILPRLHR
ncbi:MAG: serine/threonine-protein kinase [Polyangiaceae bacterium]